MSEPKLDNKNKPEILVAATLVVEESDPEAENVASPSTIEDPESAIPQTSSEKLKAVDKKTFMFAGYVFWAMIFVSGGATAAVLLSRKKSKATNQLEPPTPAPSLGCPDEKPEPGSLCLDPDLTCDYGYMNTSCEEGGLLCSPTEQFYCTSTGTDQNEWNLAVADFVCEGDNYPSTFLDSCTPMEPSAAPSVAPTFTSAPTYGVCSHDDIMAKLNSVFDEGLCMDTPYAANPEFAGMEFAYLCSMRDMEADDDPNNWHPYDAQCEYVYLKIDGDFSIPHSFMGNLIQRGTQNKHFANIEFNKGDEACNLDQADKLFEKIVAIKESAPIGPCSHTVITDKLNSVFGEGNCDNANSYAMECTLENDEGTSALAEYTFSFNIESLQGVPKTLEITYSEADTTPTVVDLEFSVESCPFERGTRTIFEAISAATFDKCPKEKPENVGACSDPGLNCGYEYRNTSCDEGVTVCSPTKFYDCFSIRSNPAEWILSMPEFFCEGDNYPSTWFDPCIP